jgi:serine/threonine protein kinase
MANGNLILKWNQKTKYNNVESFLRKLVGGRWSVLKQNKRIVYPESKALRRPAASLCMRRPAAGASPQLPQEETTVVSMEADDASPKFAESVVVRSVLQHMFASVGLSTDAVDRRFELKFSRENQVLGEGSFAAVRGGRCRQSGKQVAIKRLKSAAAPAKRFADIAQEAEILERLVGHSRIVQILDAFHCDAYSELVFEHFGVSLRDRLASEPVMQHRTRKIVSFQIGEGLAFIHSLKIVHSDLKPANILVQDEHVRLCDFGNSFLDVPGARVRVSTEEVARSGIAEVTLWYRSPEILLGDVAYGSPADIWSWGLIHQEMAHGRPVAKGDCQWGQLLRIFQLTGTPTEACWPGVAQLAAASNLQGGLGSFPSWPLSPCRSLLDRMLILDPAQRITAMSAVLHKDLQVASVLQFYGRSSLSILPASLLQGRLASEELAALRTACDMFFAANEQDHVIKDDGQGLELPARFNDRISQMHRQGQNFKLQAPPALIAFRRHLVETNKTFFKNLREATIGMTYKHGEREYTVFDESVDDSVLALATLKKFPQGVQNGCGMHVDGGISLVFAAISLEGERELKIETVEQDGTAGETLRVHCPPGHWYVSSPACFWHEVS